MTATGPDTQSVTMSPNPTQGITLTDARPEHLAAILALSAETGAAHEARQPENFDAFDLDLLARRISAQFDPNRTDTSRLYVCLDGDEPVGHVFVMITPETVGKDRHDIVARVDDISVRASHRGQGLGRRLLDHALTQVQAEGVTRVAAYVWFDNVASEAVFARAGFSRAVTAFQRTLAPSLPGAVPEKRGVLTPVRRLVLRTIVMTLGAQFLILMAVTAFLGRR